MIVRLLAKMWVFNYGVDDTVQYDGYRERLNAC